jgi:hypothetical protein
MRPTEIDITSGEIRAAVASIGSDWLIDGWFDAEAFLSARAPDVLALHRGALELLRPCRFDRDSKESINDSLLKRVDHHVVGSRMGLTFLGPYFDRVYVLAVDDVEKLWLPPVFELGDYVRRVVIDRVGELLGGRVDFKQGAALLFAANDIEFSEHVLPIPLTRSQGLAWTGCMNDLPRVDGLG